MRINRQMQKKTKIHCMQLVFKLKKPICFSGFTETPSLHYKDRKNKLLVELDC